MNYPYVYDVKPDAKIRVQLMELGKGHDTPLYPWNSDSDDNILLGSDAVFEYWLIQGKILAVIYDNKESAKP